MATLLTRRDLTPGDLAALRDLVRFGVMADDQIARRYGDPSLASVRLPLLKEGGVLFRWRQPLETARLYSPTVLGRLLARVSGVERRKTSERHLAHDVTLVDLADFLLASDASLEWKTEREVRRFLDKIAPSPRLLRSERPHRPDGLLLRQSERIGIELEHSDKSEQRYIRISSWFAREWRLDRVRWYVDDPRIIARLRQVNVNHGFDRDIQIEIEPFPPEVTMRRRPGPFDP
jgi:hypothetical protein